MGPTAWPTGSGSRPTAAGSGSWTSHGVALGVAGAGTTAGRAEGGAVCAVRQDAGFRRCHRRELWCDYRRASRDGVGTS